TMSVVKFRHQIEQTHILLPIFDIVPIDDTDPVQCVEGHNSDIEQFSQNLSQKPRWLVFNKIDLLAPDVAQARCQEIINRLNWKGPVYKISAIKRQGTELLCYDLMSFLETNQRSI
ncbi:GTPase ObgE, partial [Coxiella burnetii]